MTEKQEYVMVATTDSDMHLMVGDLKQVQMKVDRKPWMETIDGHFVRTSQVVSIWVPEPEEVENWLS